MAGPAITQADTRAHAPAASPLPGSPASADAGSPALGFTTLEQETAIDELALSGELPAWLGGSLLRTGPAKFELGGDGEGAPRQMRHWFDGLAMLHRFTIDGGRVSYGNRYLQSRSYRAAREQGRMVYGEFATDPCRSLFKRVQTLFAPKQTIGDNANVNVTRLGERFIAMTETPMPVQFDPQTLATAGVPPYEVPGELTTAHPHMDRASRGMINYAAKLGRTCSYRFFAVDPGASKPRVLGSMPVKEPAYMHSFGLTERWLVLGEFPLVVNPVALALSGRPYIENYKWKPELGTRFTLVDRASGASVGPFETDACFAFHHVNAFEQDGEVIVDLCAFADAGVIEDLYLDRLRQGKPVQSPELTRFRLKLAERSVRRERLSDAEIELPRINYGRCNERPYRYAWGVGDGPSGWLERIVKVDTHDGASLSWAERGCYPGEPVFVARPEAQDEDDGVLLSVVLDATAESSFLLALDATDLHELARARVPHHIPFGFHGQFARA
jgi:carotenoid cleavage dioxygenase-like enzyme